MNTGCVCNWGQKCGEFKTLLFEARDKVLTKMIRIRFSPATDQNIALRSAVNKIFKPGPEYDNKDFCVAAHHWAPSLIQKNFKGSSGRPSHQFDQLLTLSEARSYDCSMDASINNFESRLEKAGKSLSATDERRLLFVQVPTNTPFRVRSYLKGLACDRGSRLHKRKFANETRELLAIIKASTSSAPPLVAIVSTSAAVPSSPPDLIIPPASYYQDYVWKQHLNANEKDSPQFLEAFRMLRIYHKNFDAIEIAVKGGPKVFLYPCRDDPQGSKECLQYGVRLAFSVGPYGT